MLERFRRASKGLSQEVVAELAGLHRTYVSSIERYKCDITIYNMERLATALGVDMSDLRVPLYAFNMARQDY
jgi:transcriptional regulator with XRE-family HTH domain